MSLIERWWITVNDYGRGFLAYDDKDDAMAALGKHEESERVIEVVRADTYRGAVEALEQIAEACSFAPGPGYEPPTRLEMAQIAADALVALGGR